MSISANLWNSTGGTSSRSVTAILFEGGQAEHHLAEPILRVRNAVALETLEKLCQVPDIDRVVVCADRPEILEGARALGGIVEERDRGGFHFGRLLRELADRYATDAVLYLGGAAAPLMTLGDFTAAAGLLTWGGPRVVSNNPQSPDLIGFYPADLIHQVDPPASDNALGLALRDLPVERLLVPVTSRASFDLDTPTDLLIYREILRAADGRVGTPAAGLAGGRAAAPAPGREAGLAPALAPVPATAVRRALESLEWEQPAWAEALRRLRKPFAEVALVGRVGPHVIEHINQSYLLRLRVFSEERGMKALGREEDGLVRTLLGSYLEDVGAVRFFQRLAEVADVAFIDTRPLIAHGGRRATEADRFASDLGMVDVIQDPWLAEFTAAAVEAPLPVVLGGHSLVSGGLWALMDYAVRPAPVKA